MTQFDTKFNKIIAEKFQQLNETGFGGAIQPSKQPQQQQGQQQQQPQQGQQPQQPQQGQQQPQQNQQGQQQAQQPQITNAKEYADLLNAMFQTAEGKNLAQFAPQVAWDANKKAFLPVNQQQQNPAAGK